MPGYICEDCETIWLAEREPVACPECSSYAVEADAGVRLCAGCDEVAVHVDACDYSDLTLEPVCSDECRMRLDYDKCPMCRQHGKVGASSGDGWDCVLCGAGSPSRVY